MPNPKAEVVSVPVRVVKGRCVDVRLLQVVVNSMHERKAEMAKRSCAFIGLPGGYGTYEEVRLTPRRTTVFLRLSEIRL